MRSLVDLHCHILPALDDGALDLEDSLAMARQAQEDGIATVCATPHIRADHAVEIETLPARVAELQRAVDEAGLPVRIATGGEVAQESALGLSAEKLAAVSLGGAGAWILLEPAPGPLGDGTPAVAEALRARGVRCVIAHPERHAGADVAERLAALVARGCLVQVTAALLLDGPAAQTMLDLAAHGLVHLLGSDAHSAAAGRPVAIAAALGRLGELPLLAPHVAWIGCDGPQAILAGAPVEAPFAPA